jgi:hypothetical protein
MVEGPIEWGWGAGPPLATPSLRHFTKWPFDKNDMHGLK